MDENLESQNDQFVQPPESPSTEPVGNQVEPVQSAPQADPQVEFGSSQPDYIQPDQIKTVATNAVLHGGKAWLWYTIAGVITTLVILVGGAYWFFYVKGADTANNSKIGQTSSTDSSALVVPSCFPSDLYVYKGTVVESDKEDLDGNIDMCLLGVTTKDSVKTVSDFFSKRFGYMQAASDTSYLSDSAFYSPEDDSGSISLTSSNAVTVEVDGAKNVYPRGTVHMQKQGEYTLISYKFRVVETK